MQKKVGKWSSDDILELALEWIVAITKTLYLLSITEVFLFDFQILKKYSCCSV